MSNGFQPVRLYPEQVAEALEQCVVAQIPALLLGPPGIGKSDLTRQLADKLYGDHSPAHYRDVRLSQLDQVDVRGLPVPDLEARVTRWITPEWLPQDGEGIFVWDEITSASPALQTVMYQAILDRRIGEYCFPDGWAQLACGNEEGDRAVVYRMSTALASRFLHLWMDTDHNSWSKWALANNVPTEVIAFIRARPELLHRFDPESPDPAFPCPRTWEMTGRLRARANGVSADLERNLIAGLVGQAAATEFTAFLKMIRQLPNPTTILVAPDTVPVPDQPDVKMMICTALARHVKRDSFGAGLSWVSQLGAEYQALFVGDAVRVRPELQETRAYITWATEHAEDRL